MPWWLNFVLPGGAQLFNVGVRAGLAWMTGFAVTGMVPFLWPVAFIVYVASLVNARRGERELRERRGAEE